MVNPLVAPLGAGKSTLVSVKYVSKFREVTASILSDLYKPKLDDGAYIPKGMVARNKKLEERLQKKKELEASAA